MADENHSQMLIQQHPPSQQSHMQQSQLQSSQVPQAQLQQSQLPQSQLQQSQLQQSQLQQSQLQQSQLQQSQLQQSQLQQTQLQHSQLQQSQLQQTQLQTSQLQQPQLQQSQLQQTQLQQPQLQQTQMQQSSPMQQQSQQQGVAATMSLGSTVEQSNMNVTTSVPINVATINVSQPQQMQAIQPNINTSSGTPVQMTVPQLAAQTLPAGANMSQSSGPHTMMHPTMTMAQAPLLQHQVQVIQQPIPSNYLQHLYTAPQQQMIFPPNLTLQHTGMGTPTLQSLGTQGLVQLQTKTTLDPKTSGGQSIQPVNSVNKQGITVNAGTMMTASGQVIGTSPKTNFPQQMMTAQGKSTFIQSPSGINPTNATQQTFVIGQIVSNQQSLFNHKALTDSQKGKTFTYQNQPATLQPKSIYQSTLPVHSSSQVFNGSHMKQISSQPQIITTQAQGAMFANTQLLNNYGLQAISHLPANITWAGSNCLQSGALQIAAGSNPFYIRNQESNMIIQQSPTQAAMHLPVAAATQAVPSTSFTSTSVAPQKQKQVRVRPGTVAVGTQTNVSSAATINSNTTPIRTQIKPKIRMAGPSPLASPSPAPPQMATTQTQTNQSPPQSASQPVVQQKSEAGNQTYSHQMKSVSTEIKSTVTQSKSVSVETKPLPSPQKSQAMVAPSAKIMQATVAPTSVSITTSTLATVSSTTPVLTTSTVQANTAVSTVDAVCSTVSSVAPLPPVPQLESKALPELNSKKPVPEESKEPVNSSQQTEPKEIGVGTEHLKPQQPILKPSLGIVKDKQPQKAIVKPQVLTHVIDGLVIQEGPEPFPVSRSALLDSPCRILPSEKPNSHQKRKDSPTVASPEKKAKVHRARGNVELAKCEFCGKLGPKTKFKRSKRFCSNTCAKRHNASKRVGLLPSAIQEHVASGPGRKRKMGGRGRKSLRKMLVEDEEAGSPAEENTSAPGDDRSLVSIKMEEESSETPSDTPTPVEMDTIEVEIQKTESVVPRKPPTMWSVEDVFEFIQNTPGCSDYADGFKKEEIDGSVLFMLKEDHLMSQMHMKLGPALKLMSQIRSISEELGLS